MRGEDIHVDDTLVIKTMEEMINDGGTYDDKGGIDLPDTFYFNKLMEYLCGKTITVDQFYNCIGDEDDEEYTRVIPKEKELVGSWELSAEMLKPLIETRVVEVFNDNDLDNLLGF